VDTEYIKGLFDYVENTLKLNPNYFSAEEKKDNGRGKGKISGIC